MTDGSKQISATRLRIGVLCIALFWIPVWAITPLLIAGSSESVAKATTSIMVIQGALGLLGALIVGKPLYNLVKSTPRKKILKTFWHVLKSGEAPTPPTTSPEKTSK